MSPIDILVFGVLLWTFFVSFYIIRTYTSRDVSKKWLKEYQNECKMTDSDIFNLDDYRDNLK